MNAANAMQGPIRSWWGKLEHPRWKAAFLVLIISLLVYHARYYPLGKWPPSGADNWPNWETGPTKDVDVKVLTTLLEQNRQEIRFWQGLLFNISLVFIAGVLGIVSVMLKRGPPTESLRWTLAFAIVFLGAYYLIFAKVAEHAIALNHYDLTGIEIALKLSKKDAYLQGQPIYDHSVENQNKKKENEEGERFMKQLVPFGILLAIFSVSATLFLPIPPQPTPSE